MIVHYTNDMNSAASILSSKELVLTRIGNLDDEKDILFYLNEFNRLHYTQDVIATFKQALKLMSQIPDANQQQFLIHTFLAAQVRKESYQNGISLGGSLNSLLKQHSYMTSFRQEETSTFGPSANGEIAFEFEENPLHSPSGFELLFNKVHYTDAASLKKLQTSSSDDMTQFMESVAQETDATFTDILAAYIEKLEKQELAYTTVIQDLILKLDADNSEGEFSSLDLSKHEEAITFIHNFIVEEYTTKFRLETSQKPPTKLEIKQILKQNPEMTGTTWIDVRSILFKDNAFQQDNEIRAILLPQNKKQFNQQKKQLSAAFDTGKLRRIVISPDCANKAEWKAKLEELLSINKYSDVVVE